MVKANRIDYILLRIVIKNSEKDEVKNFTRTIKMLIKKKDRHVKLNARYVRR